jgi:ankyrin repeat protein
MHVAVKNGNVEMVKLLLGFGGKANIKNNAGKTAMDLVFECKSYAILPIFLEAAIVETVAEQKDRQDLINRLHDLVDALPKQQPCQLVPTEQRAGIEEFLNSLGRVND